MSAVTPMRRRPRLRVVAMHFQPTRLQRWMLKNRVLCAVIGILLVLVAGVLIFIREFELATQPADYVIYPLMGLGLALIVVPRSVQQRLDRDAE